jgi:hypothetical protein
MKAGPPEDKCATTSGGTSSSTGTGM